jgi:hypothetical protein
MKSDVGKDLFGEFHLESGKLIVTDPCYQRSTLCQGVIDQARPGTWMVDVVESRHGRIALLEVQHKGYSGPLLWLPCPFEVGVDSGQAGIFDEARYPTGETGQYGDSDSFYGKACEITLSEDGAGCMEFGAVSQSGFGDGSYTAYVARDRGEAVGVRVVFVDEDHLDDE